MGSSQRMEVSLEQFIGKSSDSNRCEHDETEFQQN